MRRVIIYCFNFNRAANKLIFSWRTCSFFLIFTWLQSKIDCKRTFTQFYRAGMRVKINQRSGFSRSHAFVYTRNKLRKSPKKSNQKNYCLYFIFISLAGGNRSLVLSISSISVVSRLFLSEFPRKDERASLELVFSHECHV